PRRRRCPETVERLDLPEPFSAEAFVARLAAARGRPIELMPVAARPSRVVILRSSASAMVVRKRPKYGRSVTFIKIVTRSGVSHGSLTRGCVTGLRTRYLSSHRRALGRPAQASPAAAVQPACPA